MQTVEFLLTFQPWTVTLLKFLHTPEPELQMNLKQNGGKSTGREHSAQQFSPILEMSFLHISCEKNTFLK